MFRKSIAHFVVSVLLISLLGVPSVVAQAKEEMAANLKKRIVKLGTGPEAKAQVKLQDKTKLKGYVSKIGDDSFAITDPKTNTETTVTYASVTELKTKMSDGETILLGALAGAGALVVIIAVAIAR